MTTDDHDTAHDRAVAALTELAHRTDDDGYLRDFAGELSIIVTKVAANVGSSENLISGRPGSWEADLVRQLVDGTVPEEDVLAYRTEPIRLHLDIEERWSDLGMQGLYLDDIDQIDALQSETDPDSDDSERLSLEISDIDDLYDADRTAYIAAWTDTARKVAAEMGATVPVEVTVTDLPEPKWDDVAYRIHEETDGRTPHPTAGVALDSYQWPDGIQKWDYTAAERAAGRSYRDRVRSAGTRD